jgi:hypothetical protein
MTRQAAVQAACGLALVAGNGVTQRFAGRVETGKDSVSDPAMGV